MRILGFIVLCIGLALKLWWVVVIGWAMYEVMGITWLASMGNHGNHHDHGPMN